MREVINLNNNWRFHQGDLPVERPTDKGPVYSQSKTQRKLQGPASYYYFDKVDAFGGDGKELRSEGWKFVNLPHDYIIGGEISKENNNTTGFLKYENAWYRRHFELTEADKDKRITILFEGVATHATVYLNGCLMKHNFCGYTPFEVDITDNVYFDKENVLAVYVNTEEYEGWWYQGGGIYRDVKLIKTDRVAIDLYGVYAKPVKLDDNKWNVEFETTIINENYYNAKNKRITAKSELIDKNGNVVALATANTIIASKTKAVVKASAIVENPAIWDIDDPNLYTVRTTLINGKSEIDQTEVKIGFRTFFCDPNKGFFLNGRHVKIQGVCAHQDFGLTGLAVPDNIHRHKVMLLKEMGANGYRCSHYAHPNAVMDALDEFGFIVMAETRWFESTTEGKEQLITLIKRDRNHPSIFFWSTGNEEPYHKTEVGRRINKTLYALTKQLDDQRMVMSAVSNDPGNATVYENQDVIGVNYNLRAYDGLHEKFPDKAIFASECCATSSTRGFYFENSPQQGYMTAYDMDTNNWWMGREVTWRFLMEREYVMGGYQWIAFEHRGETYWPRICSQAGAIDLYLQKKDAFYQNKSHWTTAPMVHLLPHWNWNGFEGKEIMVYAYTNCEEVELFLNGKSLGAQKMSAIDHGKWFVPYEKGELKVVAKNGGKIVAEDSAKTTGKPVALKLRYENKEELKVGDIALFTCYCVDSEGNEVPDASAFVNFACNGSGAIVGTGSDVCDHVPPTVPSRQMRAGRISIAVKVTSTENKLALYAYGDNLDKTYIEI